MVPILLQKLQVKHVALLSHSAGTIYLLNTLYHHRNLLDPERPYVALLGPWVHSDHSQAKIWSFASRLPASVITSWGGINEFINLKVFPMTSWSGGIFSSIAGVFETEPSIGHAEETTGEEKYGVPEDVGKAIEKLQTKYIFTEGTGGINQEALLCLRKGNPGIWGACEDYSEYVELLVKKEKQHRQTVPEGGKLKIDMWFAESDIMIGKGGQTYLEQLWSQPHVTEVIDVQMREKKDTNHETVILDWKRGALHDVLEAAGAVRPS